MSQPWGTHLIHWSSVEPTARQPSKSHPDDAGWDLYTLRTEILAPKAMVNLATGIRVALPLGYYGHLIGRSSTPHMYGLVVVEAVIDSGYRGDLFVQVHNPSDFTVSVAAEARLAQLLILPVPEVVWHRVDHLPPSPRGNRGFGSTGA